MLTCKVDTIDFGVVTSGEIVKVAFPVQNSGGTELLFTKLAKPCGCVGVDSPMQIPAGKSIDIDVSFNTKGRQGRQDMVIGIDTNDPQNSLKTLLLTGFVLDSVLDVGTVFTGRQTSHTFGVNYLSKIPFELKEWRLSKNLLTADISQVEEHDTRYSLNVTLTTTSALVLGPFEDVLSVDIKSASLGGRVLSLPVRGYVVGTVNFDPKEINFGIVKAGSVAERRVVFESVDGSDFWPLSVRPAGTSELAVEFRVEDDRRFAKVTFSPKLYSVKNSVKDILEFVRDGSGETVARIPIKAFIW
jgi:hypothetical protein